MTALDWSQQQSFVAVAERGSLSAAARATGGSQPTLSRHISQLEEQIGARLFERSRGGVVLTERGSDLLQIAQETLMHHVHGTQEQVLLTTLLSAHSEH